MFFFFLFVFHISFVKLASLVIIIAFNQLSLTFFVLFFSIFIIVVVLREYFGSDQWTGLMIISLSTLPLLYGLVQFGFE
jgi:hypothetical protein